MLLNQRFGVYPCKKERVQALQKDHFFYFIWLVRVISPIFKTRKDQRNVYQGKRSKNIKSQGRWLCMRLLTVL